MEDLLTTRQVQERLKVDRITIYRMVQDGRLKGIKIGQQWRFPAQEVERLLSGKAPSRTAESGNGNPLQPMPTQCIQTIQNLLSEIAQVGAIVLDAQGNPITEPTPPCTLCPLLLASPTGEQACRASWRAAAQTPGQPITCHAGLNYLSAPIYENGQIVAIFLVGQVYLHTPNAHEAGNRIQRLIALHNVNARALIDAANCTPTFSETQLAQIQSWPAKAAAAVEAILSERSGLI
jgi:excisionase family DNA binding protein